MSIDASVSTIMSAEISLMLTVTLGIGDRFEFWLITYKYSSSELLSASDTSWSVDTWLTFPLWLLCCVLCWGMLSFEQHIFTKWFGLPHLRHDCPLAGHGVDPWGQVNPHCRHVVELACVGHQGGPFVVVLVCFRLVYLFSWEVLFHASGLGFTCF